MQSACCGSVALLREMAPRAAVTRCSLGGKRAGEGRM
jgi:hypothetical protein